jgi:hypothetical protein
VIGAVTIPQTRAGVERARSAGAARYLAGRLSTARTQAVVRIANVAVLFSAVTTTVTLGTYRDANGNGVRTRDITDGIDPLIEPLVRFGDLFPGISLFLTDPSSVSTVTTTALMSFTPIGTASSRTLYVNGRDGSRYAVRVLGATGRVRVLRYVTATGQWIEII